MQVLITIYPMSCDTHAIDVLDRNSNVTCKTHMLILNVFL
jgi:hypothetical protein